MLQLDPLKTVNLHCLICDIVNIYYVCILRWCGDRVPSELISPSNVLIIYFESDNTVSETGFNFMYKQVREHPFNTTVGAGEKIWLVTIYRHFNYPSIL